MENQKQRVYVALEQLKIKYEVVNRYIQWRIWIDWGCHKKVHCVKISF